MVEFGDARQILQNPKEDYTRRLVRERVAGGTFVAAKAAESEAPILAIDHVSASYPGKPRVIDDVSLEVRSGDTVAVVGESGSGKSTLARIVTGLLPRERGRRALRRREPAAALEGPDRSTSCAACR